MAYDSRLRDLREDRDCAQKEISASQFRDWHILRQIYPNSAEFDKVSDKRKYYRYQKPRTKRTLQNTSAWIEGHIADMRKMCRIMILLRICKNRQAIRHSCNRIA